MVQATENCRHFISKFKVDPPKEGNCTFCELYAFCPRPQAVNMKEAAKKQNGLTPKKLKQINEEAFSVPQFPTALVNYGHKISENNKYQKFKKAINSTVPVNLEVLGQNCDLCQNDIVLRCAKNRVEEGSPECRRCIQQVTSILTQPHRN